MSEIRTLLSLELRSLYDINRLRYTKDKKEKSRSRSVLIAWGILTVMAFVYVGALVYGLCSLNLSEIVPAYLVVLTSLLILMFGLFTAGARIFGQRGYDILVSMPIQTSSIVISRFIALYVADLSFVLMVMLPGIVVYGVCQRPVVWFYVMALVGALFVPMIPIVITTLFGTFVLSITSRMKKKSAMQSLFSVLIVVGVMILSFSMESLTGDMTAEQFYNLAQTFGATFEKIYLPSMWVNAALVEGNVLYLALFALTSVAVMALAVFVTEKNFHAIVRRLGTFSAKHNYRIQKMESRGLLKSLYMREAKRYFSSSIYVTNTIIGPIMGTIMCVTLWIAGVETVQNFIPVPLDNVNVIPFAFAAIFCMMTTTSSAISMEGKEIWIVKSLPIPTKDWLDSKLLLNLSIMLPFYIISEAAMYLAIRPNGLRLLWMLLIPLTIMLFVVVFGITINLRSYCFDWEQEAEIVKQSMPSMVGGFIGLLLSVVFGAAVNMVPAEYGEMTKIVLCLLLLRVTYTLYRQNHKMNIGDL